jgi:cytochrome P450
MPNFRHSAMGAFAPTIQAISQRHFDRWVADPGVTVVLPAMQALVFELIVNLLMGDGAEVDISHMSWLFRTWTAGIATLPINLSLVTWSSKRPDNRHQQ